MLKAQMAQLSLEQMQQKSDSNGTVCVDVVVLCCAHCTLALNDGLLGVL